MIARRNGVLLHITSLPSPHGIGDLGPEAYRFADFLHEADQSLWQVLPLNPTTTVYGNSPYSSFSAFAGNPLLISLDRLVEDGFLTADDVKSVPSFSVERVDFEAVTAYKLLCLQKAAASYRGAGQDKDPGFRSFCSANAWWLDAYTLFTALTTAVRNNGVGMVIATGTFAGTDAVTAAAVYGMVGVLGALVFAVWWGRWVSREAAIAGGTQI
jgi:4-alpha-glucanotransferase